MRSVCRFVPLLVWVFLSGCFLAHSLGDAPSPGPSDAGPRDAGIPWTRDAGIPWPWDAGIPWMDVDAGSALCPSVRADGVCIPDVAVSPGVPFELPVVFDACVCCGHTECQARVDVEQRTLRLTTALCPDACFCEECTAPRASCAIPPLDVGSWNVVVNGAPAFTLPVYPIPPVRDPSPTCMTSAEPDPCAVDEHIEPQEWRPNQLCVAPRFPGTISGDFVVRAISTCWGCELEGPCVATLETRTTDDLPAGGEIRLSPQRHATACDIACPEVCGHFEQRCEIPSLTPGDFYRVWVDGEVVLSFTAGEDEICSIER